MDEMERRLRAAMTWAAEQAPPGLLKDVQLRHRRHIRRVGFGCVAVVAAIGTLVPVIVRAMPVDTGPSSGRVTVPAIAPTFSPTAAPGTLLLTCKSANWGQLAANWQAGSLQAGPLWFAGATAGYVHYADPAASGASNTSTDGKLREGVMIVEVADGSAATLKPDATAPPDFKFVDGYDGPSPNYLPAGDTGFTFVACPRGAPGPNGHVTDFYLGFLLRNGQSADADVTNMADQQSVRVTFTCPGRGCEG
jgi:hypothetical protein